MLSNELFLLVDPVGASQQAIDAWQAFKSLPWPRVAVPASVVIGGLSVAGYSLVRKFGPGFINSVNRKQQEFDLEHESFYFIYDEVFRNNQMLANHLVNVAQSKRGKVYSPNSNPGITPSGRRYKTPYAPSTETTFVEFDLETGNEFSLTRSQSNPEFISWLETEYPEVFNVGEADEELGMMRPYDLCLYLGFPEKSKRFGRKKDLPTAKKVMTEFRKATGFATEKKKPVQFTPVRVTFRAWKESFDGNQTLVASGSLESDFETLKTANLVFAKMAREMMLLIARKNRVETNPEFLSNPKSCFYKFISDEIKSKDRIEKPEAQTSDGLTPDTNPLKVNDRVHDYLKENGTVSDYTAGAYVMREASDVDPYPRAWFAVNDAYLDYTEADFLEAAMAYHAATRESDPQVQNDLALWRSWVRDRKAYLKTEDTYRITRDEPATSRIWASVREYCARSPILGYFFRDLSTAEGGRDLIS